METISLDQINALKKSGAKVKGSPRSTKGVRPRPNNDERKPQDITPVVERLHADTQRAIQAMKQMNDESVASILSSLAAQAEALREAVLKINIETRPAPTEFKITRSDDGRIQSVRPIYEDSK